MSYLPFLRLDNIIGASQILNFTGQTELSSFTLNGKNPSGLSSGGGGGVGKVTLGPLIVTKSLDSASVPLFLALTSGMHIPTGTLSLTQVTNAPHVFCTIDLADVTVSEISLSEAVNAPATETVSLSYGTIKFTYLPQIVTGVAANPITGGWDITKNAKI